jgi:hypothetical protein
VRAIPRPVLALVLLLPVPVLAAEAPELIEQDAAWNLADSPVHVAADCRVEPDATLTIEAGVVVEFEAGAGLTVAGSLVADGTAEEPVVFRGVELGDGSRARWGSVTFEEGAVAATFVDVDDYVGGSLLRGCRFEGANRALVLLGASPYVVDSVFVDNRCVHCDDAEGGSAIHLAPGSAPRVRDCLFENNSIGGVSWGGAIHADRAAPILQGNTFVGNEGPYGAALCGSSMVSPIVGNAFTDNHSSWEGGGITLYSSSPAVLNNEITGNTAVMDGGGVHVCIDCRPHAAPVMIDNVITNNSSAALGAGGVGAAYLRLFTNNDLHGNTTDGRPVDLGWFNERLDYWPEWVHSPVVAGNHWGTSSAASIDEAIHDGADEEGLGRVRWEPAREGPIGAPETRVALTTLRLRYTSDGEPMPVFLTLYNPGPARQVDLLLLVEYGAGARLPVATPLDFEGAERIGDAWRLTLPEDSVWFGTLVEPEFPGPVAGTREGRWHAVLLEPDTGAQVGETCSTRFELGGEPEPEERR